MVTPPTAERLPHPARATCGEPQHERHSCSCRRLQHDNHNRMAPMPGRATAERAPQSPLPPARSASTPRRLPESLGWRNVAGQGLNRQCESVNGHGPSTPFRLLARRGGCRLHRGQGGCHVADTQASQAPRSQRGLEQAPQPARGRHVGFPGRRTSSNRSPPLCSIVLPHFTRASTA